MFNKIKDLFVYGFCISVVLYVNSCKKNTKDKNSIRYTDFSSLVISEEPPEGIKTPNGMTWIPGGIFEQGASNSDTYAIQHEYPSHFVAVDGFFMDITEVTNAQFREFVQETDYVTVAERNLSWEILKNQLPPETPKPPDSLLQPGSLVFDFLNTGIDNPNYHVGWWKWRIGVNWKHPKGPGSDLHGKDDFPVVHIAYEDAMAYCRWADRSLPTEAEWEWAASGGMEKTIFTWGNEKELLPNMANTWTGKFPSKNNAKDGFENAAPVGSYPGNNFGLKDMSGNVWEWTQDWYNTNYYKKRLIENDTILNPKGPQRALNRSNPYAKEKVIKGGSFLCHIDYCGGYRISARMPNAFDSTSEHLGFRTVKRVSSM